MCSIKRFFKALYMSLGLFCAIPLPLRIWDDACLSLLLPCFPLVGALIGALWWGVAELLIFSGIHIVLTAAVLTVAPFLLTGLLHLDGYMDTNDAVLSRRPLEEKLRILKDPSIGAMAAVMLAVLFVLQFAAVYTVIDGEKALIMLILIPIMSRCCASLSFLSLKALPQSTYAQMLKPDPGTSHKICVAIIAVLTAITAYLCAGLSGLVVLAFSVLGYACAVMYAYKEFKGISGDLAGYSLVIGELCGLTALAII